MASCLALVLLISSPAYSRIQAVDYAGEYINDDNKLVLLVKNESLFSDNELFQELKNDPVVEINHVSSAEMEELL